MALNHFILNICIYQIYGWEVEQLTFVVDVFIVCCYKGWDYAYSICLFGMGMDFVLNETAHQTVVLSISSIDDEQKKIWMFDFWNGNLVAMPSA